MSNKLYQTSDGVKFYQEQDAKNHALSLDNRKVKPLEVLESKTKNDKPDEKVKSEKKTAAELISEIEQVETLQELAAYEEFTQKTVIATLEKRIVELTPVEDSKDLDSNIDQGAGVSTKNEDKGE